MIEHFISDTKINIGQVLLPGEWFTIGHVATRIEKDVLEKEASYYGTHIHIRMVVGATYQYLDTDTTYESARAYGLIVKRTQEGDVAPGDIEFDEMLGGSFFS